MFTGLIEDLGIIKEIGVKNGSTRISVATSLDLRESRVGDSISISGVCLTIVDLGRDSFIVEVSPETISRTIIKDLKRGDKVNLERAMRLTDRLGGHLVSGHIDGIGIIRNKAKEGNSIKIEIVIPGEISRYVVEKGSVAADGISMTVNDCQGDAFSVNVIPHTAEHTTLSFKRVGDKVNIETDLIGKYVEKFLHQTGVISGSKDKNISYKFLEESGFI